MQENKYITNVRLRIKKKNDFSKFRAPEQRPECRIFLFVLFLMISNSVFRHNNSKEKTQKKNKKCFNM